MPNKPSPWLELEVPGKYTIRYLAGLKHFGANVLKEIAERAVRHPRWDKPKSIDEASHFQFHGETGVIKGVKYIAFPFTNQRNEQLVIAIDSMENFDRGLSLRGLNFKSTASDGQHRHGA